MKTAESNINKIYLMMGFACNFKCRYCLQTGKCDMPTKVDKKVYDYIDRLISVRQEKDPKISIMFWGGEPLIYKYIIEQVVSYFKDKVTYTIITNGGLLDEAFIEYANANNVAVVLSYDGENTEKTRNANMLNDAKFLTLFRKLNSKGLLGVLSAYNYDYLANATGEFPYKEEMLKITWDMPKDIYTMPLQAWEEKLDAMADIALKDMHTLTNSPASEYFERDVNKALAHLLGDDGDMVPNCRQVYTSMNIDLEGNVYACHNSSLKLGTVEDDRLELIGRYEKWLNDNVYEECRNCRYWYLCKGGCPMEKEHKSKTCVLRKVYYGVVEWLTERYIKSLTEVDLNED